MHYPALLLLLTYLLSFQAFGGELESMHREKYGKNPRISPQSRSYEKANPATTEFSEVGLERGPWSYIDAPVYTVIIKSDGSFVYTGIRNVPYKGRYTGHINTDDIAPLFQFVKRSDFMLLDSFYSTDATDQETVYTMASMDGKKKVIRNEGKGGPLELWALEKLIDGLIAHASMTKGN